MQLVSIVIPVYNVAEYLPRCIASIIGQSHSSLEIILVDDGSTDGSAGLCDDFARRDRRIVVIHKENGGVSSARNAGLRAATGDFIGFADGDDWAEPVFVETMLGTLLSERAQLCICGKYFRGGVGFTIVPDETCRRMSSHEGLEHLLRFQFTSSLCNSLYVKEAVKDTYLNESIHYWEDWEFQFRVVSRIDTAAVYHQPLYHYTMRTGSATQELSDKAFSCLDIVEQVETYVRRNVPSLNDLVQDLRPMFLLSIIELAKESHGRNARFNRMIKKNAQRCAAPTALSRSLPVKAKLHILLNAIDPGLFNRLYAFMKQP